jgi:hypothetical protein
VTAANSKRLLLLVVAALVCAAAALAIGILLVGDFSETEGRILGTTALLAGYGLLALPAAILREQGRLPALGSAVVVLAVAGTALSVAALWQDEPPDALTKAIGAVAGWLVAAVQGAALAARRHEQDPRSVRRLFVASSALAVVLAGLLTAMLWAEIDAEVLGRVFGALVVLDVLLVVLQPILARARVARATRRVRMTVAPGETVELEVEARDRADAAAKAIRELERDGRRVRLVEFVDRE